MRAPANEFQEYLAADEAVIDAGSGTLLDDTRRTDGSIGVTDRRVLFVSDDGGYVDVVQSCILSVRSHPRTSITSRGIRYRLLVAAGVLVALTAFLGAAALTGGAVGTVLLLVSVCGFVLAEYVRRAGPEAVWDGLERIGRRFPVELDRVRHGRRHAPEGLDGQHPFAAGIGLLALAALIGPVALAASLLVVPLVLVTLCGLALAERAYRRERTLAGNGGIRRHEREVSIHLVDGRSVRLRVDTADRIDRALSRMVGGTARPASDTTTPRL